MPDFLYFPYFGPNRRSDRRVVEVRLDFGPEAGFQFPQGVSETRKLLEDAEILTDKESFPAVPLPDQSRAGFTSLLAQTALLFQQKCGHIVDYFSTIGRPEKDRYFALVEFAHCDVGMTSVKLAIEILTGRLHMVSEPFRLFSAFARDRLLPLETAAIIGALRRRGIPHYQLEQEPLAGKFNTGLRVRPNGMLLLGHGADSRLLDGTYCLDTADDRIRALLRNPGQRAALMQNIDIPLKQPENSPKATNYQLLMINRRMIAAIEMSQEGDRIVDDVHPSLVETALAISQEVASMPVSVRLTAADVSLPLTQSGLAVQDFDLAPELEVLLKPEGGGQALLDRAADELIDWLIPYGRSARIPIIAVTGTNGKTTTCRMINHILKHSGQKTGMVCSDGIYVGDRQVSDEDACTFLGHTRALTSKLVEVAVLEAHHRGIAIRGFAFDHCDIAVCLNVTPEHLEKGQIETVEEMAEVKRALPERASEAAVLFADDSHCAGMIDHLNARKICLVSLRSDAVHLRSRFGEQAGFVCVLEPVEGEDWIVIHAGEEIIPVMAVNQIPATFEGTARFNVSNAMHAVSASWLVGTDVKDIRTALEGFSAGYEMTPGRMNVFDDLPFRIIIDFAHNPDGAKQISEFADHCSPRGRKLIAFAGASNRTDKHNMLVAREIAGHFDHYFCKEYDPSKSVKPANIAPLIRQTLIDEGVPEEDINIVTYGRDEIFSVFDRCEPGDLLIMLLGHVEKHTVPAFIKEYAAR